MGAPAIVAGVFHSRKHLRKVSFGECAFPNLLNNTSNSRFFLILSAFFGFRPVLPILNKTIKYRISFVHGVTL